MELTFEQELRGIACATECDGTRMRINALLDKRKADGGAAFGEFKQVGDSAIKSGGITVRDYFAAKAMQSLLITPTSDWAGQGKAGETAGQMMTRRAYCVADFMLQERAK